MTPQELLGTHAIELPSYDPGRHYTTCPQCSRGRTGAHCNNKVLGVTIEGDGAVRWGCNHCGWTGPHKGNGGHREELKAFVYRDRTGAAKKDPNPPTVVVAGPPQAGAARPMACPE